MKNFARCLVMLFLIGVSSNLLAQEWIAHNQYVSPQYIQTVYIQPQPVIIYQWVPYTFQQHIFIEQRRLFCVNQTVVARPAVQWVLQPVLVYK